MTVVRHPVHALQEYATSLLEAAGMETGKAAVVAGILVEGDLLGHSTHGLHLLGPYLGDIARGEMALAGEPEVVGDKPAAVTWDGRRLPGPWLVVQAMDLAIGRAREFGTCTVSIRRSHHIACLAAYLKRATDQGMVMVLLTSAPENSSVAPHGGRRGAITPNPIAAAWPTAGDPVMVDVSTSITTNGMVGRLAREGGRLPGKWLIDAEGEPTDDPAVMQREPKGALLPIGGVEYGHKGYALGLWVEAMTQGLAGHGRADPIEGWMGEVFVQLLDPAAFSGLGGFVRQTDWIATACRATPPRPGVDAVRLPGEHGLARRRTPAPWRARTVGPMGAPVRHPAARKRVVLRHRSIGTPERAARRHAALRMPAGCPTRLWFASGLAPRVALRRPVRARGSPAHRGFGHRRQGSEPMFPNFCVGALVWKRLPRNDV